ncbi:MAG: hypothetical protein AABY00_03045 [Nanoarchaeota archaeon]|mgnify:CR=1 FL=1
MNKEGVSKEIVIIVIIIGFLLLMGGIFFFNVNKKNSVEINDSCFENLSYQNFPEKVSKLSVKVLAKSNYTTLDTPLGEKEIQYYFSTQYTSTLDDTLDDKKTLSNYIFRFDDERVYVAAKENITNDLNVQGISYRNKNIEGFDFMIYQAGGRNYSYGNKGKTGIHFTFTGNQEEMEQLIKEYLRSLCDENVEKVYSAQK